MVNIPIKPTGHTVDIARSGKLFLTLKPAQIIGVKVIAATQNSIASLLINNKTVEVRTSLEFKEGESLLLRVDKNNPKTGELRLSPVRSAKSGTPSGVKAASPELFKSSGAARLLHVDITSFKSMVSNLDSSLLVKIASLKAINSFIIPMEKAHSEGGEGIKKALKTSGLFLEANIKEAAARIAVAGAGAKGVKKEIISSLMKNISTDFKGALIKLKVALKETETIEILRQAAVKPEELAVRVDKLIKNIEFFQIQSKLNDTLELFIPFFWKSLRDGELVFSQSYKGASDAKSYSCTINLDLESSGRVSAIVLLIFDSIHLSFVAEKKEFIALINASSAELKSKFKELGLPLGSVRATREENLDFKASPHKSFEEGFNVKA